VTGDAIRVGDTVRRPAAPWSASVQAVLAHLHGKGVSCVPSPLGFDEQGREVVGYVRGAAGDAAPAELVWRESTLEGAARLLRRCHDATADFEPPPAACWMLAPPDDLPVEVVCHNDFAPDNVVFDGHGPVGVIDWETAAPGSRIWDVAYAAYRFVPLSSALPAAAGPAAGLGRRLARFCDAYGLAGADRERLLPTAIRRVSALRDLIVTGAAGGNPVFAAHLADGHADAYGADLAHLRAAAGVLAASL
jgi:hypothetical protein